MISTGGVRQLDVSAETHRRAVETGLPVEYLERFVEAQQRMAERMLECSTPMELAIMLHDEYGLGPVGSILSEKLGVRPVLGVVASNSDGAEYFKPFDPLSGAEAGEWVSEADAVSRLDSQFTEEERSSLDQSLRFVTERREGGGDPDGWSFARLAQGSGLTKEVQTDAR